MKTEQEHSEKDEQDDIYFLQRKRQKQNFSLLLHNLKLKSDTLETNESKENENQSTRTIVEPARQKILLLSTQCLKIHQSR